MLIRVICHCENISSKLAWQPTPEAIDARACACSFCVTQDWIGGMHATPTHG